MSGLALVALHFQNDVLHADGRIALGLAQLPDVRTRLLDGAARLLKAARAHGLALIHVRIAFRPDYADGPRHVPILNSAATVGAVAEGSWGVDFFEPLAPLAGEAVFTHNRVNAFCNPDLEAHLQANGLTRLILAGVATNSTVEHSARHAADLGLAVILAEDACASARPDLHAAALENVRLIGQVMTVDQITRDVMR